MGYQIVEIETIDKIIKNQFNSDLSIPLLLWLTSHLNDFFNNQPIEIELIKVDYISTYPALGIKYLEQDTKDYEEEVIDKVTYILNNYTIANFLSFLNENQNLLKVEYAKFE